MRTRQDIQAVFKRLGPLSLKQSDADLMRQLTEATREDGGLIFTIREDVLIELAIEKVERGLALFN